MVFNMEYHLLDILQVHQRSLESNGLRLELSQTDFGNKASATTKLFATPVPPKPFEKLVPPLTESSPLLCVLRLFLALVQAGHPPTLLNSISFLDPDRAARLILLV